MTFEHLDDLHADPNTEVLNADCLAALRDMPDASVDAVVTDPPYGLSNTRPDQVAETITRWVSGDREYLPTGRGFMGHEWDAFVPPVAVWDECLRVLKPGGHLLAFAGSRTHDLMTLGIRLAGFDIRDSVAWLYGSGFPKSMDVSKAIDKAAGADREVVGKKAVTRILPTDTKWGEGLMAGNVTPGEVDLTAPATDAARQWEGWGTALKPAFEPVTLARKPLDGTVAANVLEHGTGALNIDGCRIGTDPAPGGNGRTTGIFMFDGFTKLADLEAAAERGERTPKGRDARATLARYRSARIAPTATGKAGRWPANVVLDESQAEELDRQSGVSASVRSTRKKAGGNVGNGVTLQSFTMNNDNEGGYNDSGGASRFFYVAKASKAERPVVDGVAHSTVKPLTLMRWLVRMVTPPGGTVLDPFAGSGTTLEAATLEGFNSIGIEREADYLPLIHHRVERATTARKAAEDEAAGYLFSLEGDST